jgi:hypothetical protein
MTRRVAIKEAPTVQAHTFQILKYLAKPLAFLTLLISTPLYSQELLVGDRAFAVFPQTPSTFHPIVLKTEVDRCSGFSVTDVRVNQEDMKITVMYAYSGVDFDPCPPGISVTGFIPIEGVEATGVYELEVYENSSLLGVVDLTVSQSGPVYWVETPIDGSQESGIGIVRGWACDADSVEIRFNNASRQSVAYGDSRTDTIDVCGDEDNGYGFVIGWGNLGKGFHSMTTYIDEVPVSDVDFEVVGLDAPFVKGLTGTFELYDFPQSDNVTQIRWSEAEQKFVVIGSDQ